MSRNNEIDHLNEEILRRGDHCILLAKEILHLKELIRESVICMKSICDLKGCAFDDIHEFLNKVKDI